MKKVLAIIPARAGSKRVPKKNIRLLAGSPLVAHIINAAKGAQSINRIVVSTDDAELAMIARKFGADVPFMRPEELSGDETSLTEVVRYTYEKLKSQGEAYDVVISLQPTCPFLSSATIEKAVEIWQNTNCECVTSVAQLLQGHPYITKRISAEGQLSNFVSIPEGAVVSPSHKREKCFYLTGGLYLQDKRLLEGDDHTQHCLGKDARAVVVNEYEATDINYEIDFKYAEFLLHEGLVKVNVGK